MVNDKQELIGDYLKKHREKLDISIKIVANDTKINITQLEYLENNDFDKLPNIAYVRGFVKNYSRTLSLNLDDCLEVLENSYYPTNISSKKKAQEEVKPIVKDLKTAQLSKPIPREKKRPTENNQQKKPIPTAILAGAGFTVLIVIMLISNSGKDEADLAPPIVKEIKPQTLNLKTKLLKPQDDTVVLEKENQSHILETKNDLVITKKEVKPIIQTIEKPVVKIPEVKIPEPKPITPIVEKKVEVLAETQKKTSSKIELKKEINFSKLPSPLFSIDDTLSSSDIADFLPNNIKNSMLASRENLYINSTFGDTWITYKVDENPIKKYVLKKGRTLFLKGQLIRVFLGNVHVTKIFHNNKPLEIESRSGVKSLVFPVKNASDYVLPLFVYPKSGKVITSETYLNANNEN